MIALLVAALGPIHPAPVAPVRYHITSKTTSDLDLTALGQPAQSVVIVLSAFVSVTMSDSAGGKAVHVVIDSSTFDGGSAAQFLPPEMTADPKGASYDVLVINGKPQTRVTPVPMSIQAAQLAPAVALLFTGLRSARPGESWVDTVTSDTTVAQAAASGSTITTWTVKSADGGALQFDGTWTGTTSVGSGQMQMDLQVSGASHTAGAAGSLAETASSLGTGQAKMNLGGQEIPMKVTTDLSAARIP